MTATTWTPFGTGGLSRSRRETGNFRAPAACGEKRRKKRGKNLMSALGKKEGKISTDDLVAMAWDVCRTHCTGDNEDEWTEAERLAMAILECFGLPEKKQ